MKSSKTAIPDYSNINAEMAGNIIPNLKPMTTTSVHSATTTTLQRIRLLFPLVLVSCVIVPILKVRQLHTTPTSMMDDEISNYEQRRLVARHSPIHEHPKKNYTNADGALPFTRSYVSFEDNNSTALYVYIVNTIMSSASSSPLLEWSEVQWEDLIDGWNQDTAFTDLLRMSATTLYTNDGSGTLPSATSSSSSSSSTGPGLGRGGTMRTKLILHCLPKTASTTLRTACNIHLRKNCPSIDYPIQQDPYGYRNITEFQRAIVECRNIHHFCIQGGSANMDVINYNYERESGGNTQQLDPDRSEPCRFIHMIPFRNFHDWVESAIKQIYSIDGHCAIVDKILDRCLGYRELYFELYSKSVVSLLARMIFHYSNQRQQQQMDTHHMVLYNYKDTESIVSQVSDFFLLAPLSQTSLRLKDQSSKNGTCPDSNVISEKFRTCHSDALMRFNYSMALAEEKNRRVTNNRNMIRLLQRIKKSERQVADEGESED